ncbi:hypothetical protein HHS34_005245 [Acidithiobacillus montserratensis]|uniref:Uncharacterized protein n=1 Tax=Acidithiobacillus montserratensis TaxID=2729135 RepID=A0ACD5HI50_9PROT|nr:hypothetical protein [Acidithiobacillus montserratensis]MBU2747818.1 hypothetical protein [Acidithiobacillus montserratensis]
MPDLDDCHGRNAALAGLVYLGQPQDLSPLTLFRLLSHPQPHMALRDLEPVLGHFMRHADPQRDAADLMRSVVSDAQREDWPGVQRGGYLLDLLGFFASDYTAWQGVLLPWLDDVASALPQGLPRVPFYPEDPRNSPLDALAVRWNLSSGVLYDRLKKLLKPPYVC